MALSSVQYNERQAIEDVEEREGHFRPCVEALQPYLMVSSGNIHSRVDESFVRDRRPVPKVDSRRVAGTWTARDRVGPPREIVEIVKIVVKR